MKASTRGSQPSWATHRVVGKNIVNGCFWASSWQVALSIQYHYGGRICKV